MSKEEQNKAVVRRVYNEAFGERNLEILDELMADDFVAHAPTEPGHDAEDQDLERLKSEFRRNFRDTLCQGAVSGSRQGAIAEPRAEIGATRTRMMHGDALLPVIPVTSN